MYYAFSKKHKRYLRFPKPEACDFCDPQKYCAPMVTENDQAYVIPNRNAYDQWEMSKVLEHLMVIPKRHVLHLAELSSDERSGVMDLISQYEADGYEIYARSQSNITRSVPHQHTHLIKTEHKPKRFMIFSRKPWILWLFG